jgi:hypothetical protein
MPKPLKKPALVHHRPTGQARVRIDGRDHYLGRYGSQETLDAYDDLIRDWLIRQGSRGRVAVQVDNLCLLYTEFAES